MKIDQKMFRMAVLSPDADRPEGLTDGTGNPAGRRFDVYRNNVAVSLTEALETAFPVVRKLVGDANFKLIASVFLRQHPPSSPLMMFYGAKMPEFLARFDPTKSIQYLPDIARLELALRDSYHAADSEAIDPAVLQSMAPDALMASNVSLAPSLRLVRSPWPIHAIWRFNMEEDAPKPEMAAEDVAVIRAEMDPEPVLLPPGGGEFVAALRDGQTFGAALAAASEVHETFDLSRVLALLIGTNAITKIGD